MRFLESSSISRYYKLPEINSLIILEPYIYIDIEYDIEIKLKKKIQKDKIENIIYCKIKYV